MTEHTLNRVLIAFVIVWGICIIVLWNCNGMEKTVVKPVTIIERWKNNAGDSVASLKGFQEQFAYREKRIADSLAKVYNTKTKHLQEYIIALQQTIANVPATGNISIEYDPDRSLDHCPPAIKNMKQRFANPYFDITAQIGDSSYLQLQAFDTITVLWKKVNQGSIFSRKHYLQLDVSNANPYTRTAGLMSYRIEEKKAKKLGIGLQIGYGLQQGLKPKPYLGIGLSYNLIRI